MNTDPLRGTGRTSRMMLSAFLTARAGKNVTLVFHNSRAARGARQDFLDTFRCRGGTPHSVRVEDCNVTFAGLEQAPRHGWPTEVLMFDHYVYGQPWTLQVSNRIRQWSEAAREIH